MSISSVLGEYAFNHAASQKDFYIWSVLLTKTFSPSSNMTETVAESEDKVNFNDGHHLKTYINSYIWYQR